MTRELQGTIIVTIGTFLGSFFSYLLQFFLGRMLSVEDYGTFNALLSLSYLIWVPSGVLTTSLIKTVSGLSAKNDFSRLTALFWRVFIFALCAGLLFFSLIYLSRGLIAGYLNISDPKVIIYFGLFIATSFVGIAPSSYLQGLLRYRAYAFYIANNNFLRWLIPSALVFYGFKLFGVFTGIASASLLSFLVGVTILKKNFENAAGIDLREQVKGILYFGIPVLFVNFGMMFLNNIDMLLVKRFFEPETAGYYAGTVTLGKILLFGAGAVTVVMFPKISSLYTQGRDYMSQFKSLLLLQLFLVSAGVAVFSVFPKILTHAFFGERFNNSVEYLPRFVIFIGIYVLINFMVMFFLAIEKVWVFLFLLPVIVAQYALITLHHNTLYEVMNVNIAVSCVLYLILWFYLRFRILGKPSTSSDIL